MIDKANLKDFISDLSKCITSSSQSLEVTVMRVVSLSLFVYLVWLAKPLFKIVLPGLSVWFILASEWLSSQCCNQILHIELAAKPIDKSSGKATSFPLYSSILPESAQVYDLSFSINHSQRSISELGKAQKLEKAYIWHKVTTSGFKAY